MLTGGQSPCDMPQGNDMGGSAGSKRVGFLSDQRTVP